MDTSRIRARKLGETDVWVELCGEFDVGELETLRGALDDALSSGPLAYVDLSGVTFLDFGCARELAVRVRSRGGRLVLRDFSWQARISFEVCGLGDRIGFHPGREHRPRIEAPNNTGETRKALARTA